VVLVCVPLVSWSMICCQDSCFVVRQRRIAEEYLSHNFDEHCFQDLAPFLPKWRGTIPWALRRSTFREIDCGNLLARGYMQAHHHCELLYPPAGSAPKLANGKRRGFSPAAATGHLQSARVHTDLPPHHLFPSFSLFLPSLMLLRAQSELLAKKRCFHR